MSDVGGSWCWPCAAASATGAAWQLHVRRLSAAALSAAALLGMTCSLCTRHQAHTNGRVSVCWVSS